MKEKLLGLGVFVDNEYLDLYCSIIKDNLKSKRIKYQTQAHHVIPCCLYDSRELATKDPKNFIVHLQYKDHVLAHYYLTAAASEPSIQAKLFLAIKYQLGWNRGGNGLTPEELQFKTEFKLSEEFQQLYEKAKQAVGQLRRTYNNRPVICIETQEIFSDLYEAEEAKGISFVERACTGRYKTAGKYHWCWLDDKERQEQLKSYIAKKPKAGYRGHNNIRVLCIETGKEYDSALAAKRDTGAAKILECLYQIRNESGGLHWARADDAERIEELKLLIAGKITSSTITTKKPKKLKKDLTEFEAGLLWTAEELEILKAQYHSKGSAIPDLLERHSNNSIRQKAHKLGLTFNIEANQSSVQCKETGQKFTSAKEAAMIFNTTTNSLYSALNTGCKAAGYHWEYVN